MKFLVVIPARLKSRLPNKPLININGLPIVRTYKQCSKATDPKI